MTVGVRSTALLALSTMLLAGQASAADLAAGKRLFNRCKACHSLVAGKQKIGPTLYGVFGRTAGALEGYNYSRAMKAAGEERQLVWNEETIDEYLARPRDFIPRNKMAFPGLKSEEDRENLIAYLKEATE